jgi:hypothetical protein
MLIGTVRGGKTPVQAVPDTPVVGVETYRAQVIGALPCGIDVGELFVHGLGRRP